LTNSSRNPLPLEGFRALDLTNENGYLCGKVLGDLGADVIKVEPPAGDSARRLGPFYHDDPHPEKSLSWWAYNTNKRSITLNLDTIDGQELFKKLVARSDFLVETFPPGYLKSLGLDYSDLEKINPKLVMTTITPFGSTGPYKDYAASDIVIQAAGGLMHLCGNEDRAPVRVSVPIAHAQAGVQAALGSVIAHYSCSKTGEGQHVETSMQAAIVNNLIDIQQHWDIDKRMTHRGARIQWGPILTGLVYKCKDGYVVWKWFVDKGRGRRNTGLIKWMAEEGEDEGLAGWDFESMTLYNMTQAQADHMEATVAKFFAKRTKAEIYGQALKRRFLTFPVSSPADILGNQQLESRRFFQKIPHPELNDSVTYPGAFVKSTASDYGVRSRPPLIGEHNEAIYLNELGLSKNELTMLKEAGIV